MLFWFRIAIVILRSLFFPARRMTEEATLALRVWPLESEVRFANQAMHPHYLELARWAWAVTSAGERQR